MCFTKEPFGIPSPLFYKLIFSWSLAIFLRWIVTKCIAIFKLIDWDKPCFRIAKLYILNVFDNWAMYKILYHIGFYLSYSFHRECVILSVEKSIRKVSVHYISQYILHIYIIYPTLYITFIHCDCRWCITYSSCRARALFERLICTPNTRINTQKISYNIVQLQ